MQLIAWSVVPRRLFLVLLLSALGLLTLIPTACTPRDADPADDAGEAIRVVAWNIEWFPGRSPEASPKNEARHRKAVRSYLSKLKPDILLLQEIRDEEAAQFLADAVPGLELHVTTAFTREDSDRSQQLVIASRYPARAGFAEVFTDIYSDPDVTPYRGFAFAALETPLGGTLLTYSLHLKSNLGAAEDNIPIRETSAQQLLEHISEMKELYAEYGPVRVIVGGDFNLLLEQEEMAHERTLAKFVEAGFHWGWEGVPFEERITWPASARYGNACFDHFLTWGLPPLTSELVNKPEGELSDHRPIRLRIPLEDDHAEE